MSSLVIGVFILVYYFSVIVVIACQEQFWHGLLIGCIFTATVCSSEDATARQVVPNSDEYKDEIVAAEDHEHHRIIIVVPKEVPQHVNHVHTYKLAGKGIPLIHSGKVVHDHKHSGKVAHEHGHAGKSTHSHKHSGAYGHQHKHLGYMGHKHFGKVGLVGHGHGHKPVQQPPRQSPHDHHNRGHHPLLHNAAHQLHLHQLQQAGDYLVQQHGNAGGSSGVLQQGGGRRPGSSGHIQFVPSSRPRGLGSFMPAEIQQYVQHGAVVQQHQQLQHQQLQHQQHHQQQQQQQQHAEYDDDESGGGRSAQPPAYNVIHLRVPDHNEPNVIKHVDIDLINNVAKLQTSEKQQPVTANFKSVTQYNKVIGHGRAVAAGNAEDEFDAQTDDEDAGGELLLEDAGYRFGEGYRLAMDTGARDFSAAQEQDEEEVDESFKEPLAGVDDEPSDGGGGNNAYSQTYSLPF